MGIKILSFRIALAIEEAEWKPFQKVLSKSYRKKFDEMMFDIPRLYISARSYAIKPIKRKD